MRSLLALGLACVLCVAGRATTLEWFESARMGDWPVLERELAAGTDINQVDYTGMTALHHALALGQTEVVRRLLDNGADPDKGSKKYSSMDWAVFGGDLESFQLLLDHGKSFQRFARPEILHLFEQAIMFGRADFVTELEKRGAALKRGRELDDALNTAVRSEQPELARHLLELGADPNQDDRNGKYPLALASFHGDVTMVDLLLSQGARIDTPGTDIPGLLPAATALTSAVLGDHPAVVQSLLRAGANPRVMDDTPMILADLIGDEHIRADLLASGAVTTKPFAFAKWMPGGRQDAAKDSPAAKSDYWGGLLAGMGVFKGNITAKDALADRKLAVIALDDGMKNGEALLTVRLPEETGATLLERDEMRRIARERNLQDMLATPGKERLAGRLLGADVLVLLREHKFAKGSVREAKIVAVRTGLVMGTALCEGKTSIDSWVDETIAICRTAGPLASGRSDAIRLMSVPRVVASRNTPLGRELERQLTITLAARLGRLPGVMVVERNDLDRLALEQDPETSAYATSAWLLDATLDMPANETSLATSLLVTMKSHGSNTGQTLRVDGSIDHVAKLVNDTVDRMATIVAGSPAEPLKTSEEADAFLVKAGQFERAFLWDDVASSIEAARALGLDSDEVTRLRMEAAVQRIIRSSQRLTPDNRERSNYQGLALLVSYRAPLIMPPGDPRELDLDGYLDNANLALDIFATSLALPAAKMAGVPFSRWICGEFWDAATVPLRLTESLSYSAEYAGDLEAIRNRLLELNARAASLALERGDSIAFQTLLGIRLKHLAWWMPNEGRFQAEARRILAQAHDWTPPMSEQSVWRSAYESGREQIRKTSGRAGQAWLRLAKQMERSDNPNERFLGTCLLGMETIAPGRHWEAIQALRNQFPEVNRIDRGVTTEIYDIAINLSERPHLEIGCQSWYEKAFVDLLRYGIWPLTYDGLWQEYDFSITGQNGRLAPEFRGFMMEQALARAKALQQGDVGGFVGRVWNEKNGFSAAELNELGKAYGAALPLLENLSSSARQRPYALEVARRLANVKGKETTPVSSEVKTGPVRNPFFKIITCTPADRQDLDLYTLTTGARRNDSGWNLIRQYTYDKLTEERVESYYAFTFDPTGQPENFRWLPKEIGAGISTNGNNIMANDRWLCMDGFRIEPNAEWTQDLWLAFDLRQKSATGWHVYKAASNREFHGGGALIGDHLVYPFVHNPTGPKSGGPDEFMTKGDPTFGVMDIDLTEGHERLLASSRRQPATNPLEQEQIAPYTGIITVSSTGFVVVGRQKTSNQVYDTVGQTWTLYDQAFKAAHRPTNPPRPPTNQLRIEGHDLNLDGTLKHGKLLVYSKGKGPRFEILITLPENEDLIAYSEYIRCINDFKREQSRPLHAIGWLPDGGVIWMGSFYYWIPMDQVRDAVRAQLLRSTASSQ